MATAGPSGSPSLLHNQVNTLRLIRLLNEAATDALRRLFSSIHPPTAVSGILNSHAIKTKITHLLHSRVLNTSQWHKLYPPTGTPDVKTFDVSLLFSLLRNICGLKSATDPIWTSYPLSLDRSDEANVARVRWYRNEVIHGCTGGVDDHTFATYWADLANALKDLGTAQSELDALEKGALDVEKFQAVLLEWRAEEEDLRTGVRDVKGDTEEIIDSLKGLLQTVTNLPNKLEETAAKLQESVKKQLKVELANQPNNDPREGSDEKDFSALRKLVRINFRGDVDFHSRRWHPGTREWIFSEVDEWLNSNTSGSRVLVVTGSPGMGKTVIAAQLSKRMERSGNLAAFHFCHHGNSRHNNPKLMLQSLACSLCDVLPEYKQALAQQLLYNVGLDFSLDEMTVEELFTLLLQEPLNAISEPSKSYLGIIDAVDEAEHSSRNELLDAIAAEFGKLPVWLKFLITTRSDIKAVEKLQHLLPLQIQPQSTENMNDMYLYLKEKLQPHIVEDDLEASLAWVMENSSGLMLHAYYLVDFIVKQRTKLSYQVVRSSFPKGISSVYEKYVRRLQKELGVDENNLCNLLASIVAAKEPLHISLVPRILGLRTNSRAALGKVRKAVESISILLPVKDDRIYVFHKSFVDWLQDSKVYKEHDFSITEKDGHQVLADVCSDCFQSLKICVKSRSSSYAEHTQKPTDPVVEYVCIYGIHHMLKAVNAVPEILKLANSVHDLEVMFGRLKLSNTCSVHHLIEDCLVLLDELRDLHCPGEVASLENVIEVLRKEATLIEKNSDVLFSSFVNKANGQEVSFAAKRLLSRESLSTITWLEVLNRDNFHNELQLELNCTETIIDFDLTRDGKFAACTQEDGSLTLWSLISGRKIWTKLCGAKCCKFSPDGDYIIYGYLDTVYSTKGECLPMFPHNKHEFIECSFSPDEIRLLTLSKEGQVTMWDVRACKQMLKLSSDGDVYNCCVFSPCGKFVAAVKSTRTRYSADVTLVAWNANNGKGIGNTTKSGVFVNDSIVKCLLSWLSHSPKESYICCTVHGFRNSLEHISFCCTLTANKCVCLTEVHSNAHTCLKVLQASRNARFAVAQLRQNMPNNKQLEMEKSLQLLPFKTRLYFIPQGVYRLIDVSERTVLIKNEPYSSKLQLIKGATRHAAAEPVSCIAMTSTGDRVYALCHETVIMYSGSSGEMITVKYFADTHSLYVLPNGNPVICQKETVNVYNPDLSELQVVVEGVARPVHCTNHGVLYVDTSASLHNTILSTKFDTRETKTVFKLDEGIVSGDVSEDGSTVVLGGALGTIVLVNEDPGLATVETVLPEQYPIVCKISRDCSTVVVQHSRHLFVLNAFSGELVKQIPVENQFGRYARACNFLYDNRHILMCAGSGVICICNLESGENVPVAKLHNLSFEKALFDVLSNPVSAVVSSAGLAAFGTVNGGVLLVKLHIPYTNV